MVKLGISNIVGLILVVLFLIFVIFSRFRKKKKIIISNLEEVKMETDEEHKEQKEPDWSKFNSLFDKKEEIPEPPKDQLSSIKDIFKKLDEELKINIEDSKKVLARIGEFKSELFKRMEVCYNMHKEVQRREEMLKSSLKALIQNQEGK